MNLGLWDQENFWYNDPPKTEWFWWRSQTYWWCCDSSHSGNLHDSCQSIPTNSHQNSLFIQSQRYFQGKYQNLSLQLSHFLSFYMALYNLLSSKLFNSLHTFEHLSTITNAHVSKHKTLTFASISFIVNKTFKMCQDVDSCSWKHSYKWQSHEFKRQLPSSNIFLVWKLLEFKLKLYDWLSLCCWEFSRSYISKILTNLDELFAKDPFLNTFIALETHTFVYTYFDQVWN